MDIVPPGGGLPPPDGQGEWFVGTRVTHFAAGNELLDREAGGVVRTVARVRTIIRLELDPMEGQPDHRDYDLASPDQIRQWGRKGVPAAVGGVHRDQAPLEDSWAHRDRSAADGVTPYPDPED